MFKRHGCLSLLTCLAISYVQAAGGTPRGDGEKPVRVDRYGDPLPEGAIARFATARLRHAGPVMGVAFSPNSKLLTSKGEDGTIRLWDVSSGAELRHFRQFQPQACYSTCVAFSPDGKAVGSQADGEVVCFWDVASGQALRRFPAKKQLHVTAFALSPDGKLLAVNEANVRTLLWEVASGKLRQRLDGGHGQLVFSPDGTLLADSAGKFWAIGAGKATPRLALDEDERMACVVFAPDGRTVATVDADPRETPGWAAAIRLWKLDTGDELCRWELSERGIHSLAFSPDGKLLASGSEGTTIRVWEAASGNEVRRLQGPPGGVENVSFSPDGKLLAAWGSDCRISIWDFAKSRPLHSFAGTEALISCIALSPDGRILACGEGATIRLREVSTGKELVCLQGHRALVLSLAFTSDSRLLASGGDYGTTRLWEVDTGKSLQKLDDTGGPLAISPDGKILATGGRQLSLRELATGKELLRFSSEGHVSRCLAFSVDGRYLASAAEQGDSYLFDTKTGQRLCPYGQASAHYPVCSQAFSPDGEVLVAVQPRLGLSILLLDRATKKWRERDRGHEIFGRSVAFSPNGTVLALGTVEGRAQLWNPATGQDSLMLKADPGTILTTAFSGDGTILASRHADGTAIVWNMSALLATRRASGVQLSTLQKELLWYELDAPEDFAVYRSMCILATAQEQAVPFLHQRLRAVGSRDARIERLLTDLDDDVFATRERASRELAKLSELAEPSLRKALADGLSVEATRRVEKVLKKLEERGAVPVRSEWLCAKRAIRVLERIATPEARRVLEELAQGVSETDLAQAAKASLGHLAKQPAAAR